ncbi:25259_t:CDS:1, partial [Gigaspora margarita]
HNILKACFSNLQFLDSDLANYIQKFKRDNYEVKDASKLLNSLLANKIEDSR